MSQNPHLLNSHLNGDPILSLSRKTGILLMHGFTATPYEVRGLAESFIEKGFSVAAPALAGHNTSPDDMLVVHWKDWLQTGIDGYKQLSEHCDQIFVGGESTGAVVALLMAAVMPEIAGVIAFSPAMKLPLSISKKVGIKLLSGIWKFSPKNDLEGNTTWQGYRVNPVNGVKQLLNIEKETISKLSAITQPVIVLMGGEDKTIDLSSGDIVIEGVSSKTKALHFYPDAEHCILLGDAFEETANLALEFVMQHTISK